MKKQNYILGIDIGNSKTCSLIADIQGNEPQILGIGIAPSRGIKKGNIQSIDSVAKALQKSLDEAKQIVGVEIAGFVLSSYASAIAVLSDDEKELGVCCVDMGSGVCNFMIHYGNSLQYEDFLQAGSWNVTNDIATELSTAMETAEHIKKQFATLSDLSAEEKEMLLDSVPTRSGETRSIKCEALHSIVFGRVFEMLQRIEQSIKKSDLQKKLGAGIVITGGLSCMRGLQEVAQKVFAKLSVRIAMPKEANKSFEIIRKVGEQKSISYHCFSTAIGLILYASGGFTNCEIDANHTIKFK